MIAVREQVVEQNNEPFAGNSKRNFSIESMRFNEAWMRRAHNWLKLSQNRDGGIIF
jgi:hypothetical protein